MGGRYHNPISYVEQISYLLCFLKMLDETGRKQSEKPDFSKRRIKTHLWRRQGKKFRWSAWSQITDTKRFHKFVRDDVLGFHALELRGREEIRRLFEDAQLQIPDVVTRYATASICFARNSIFLISIPMPKRQSL